VQRQQAAVAELKEGVVKAVEMTEAMQGEAEAMRRELEESSGMAAEQEARALVLQASPGCLPLHRPRGSTMRGSCLLCQWGPGLHNARLLLALSVGPRAREAPCHGAQGS